MKCSQAEPDVARWLPDRDYRVVSSLQLWVFHQPVTPAPRSDDTIARIVERSSVLNLPMIQVSMNYRYLIFSFVTCQEYSEGLRRISGKLYDKEYLSVCVYSHTITTAYGFLAGKEISSRKLGNIGLFDRQSLCTYDYSSS